MDRQDVRLSATGQALQRQGGQWRQPTPPLKGDGQTASDSPKGRAVQVGWFLHQVAERSERGVFCLCVPIQPLDRASSGADSPSV